MCTTAVITMGDVKSNDIDNNSLWQSYNLHTSAATTSQQQTYDHNFPPPPSHYYTRPQVPTLPHLPAVREDGLSLAAPVLTTHHSYPSLKRMYDGGNDVGYLGSTHDIKDDVFGSHKPSIDADHRLLNFGPLPHKHVVFDAANRVKSIDLNAQIHGMFFLSELATPSLEHVLSQPELTCYRRNLFSISGSVRVPRGPLSIVNERGERSSIVSMEVTITASESVDNHAVKLIVIPWKTPPPNSDEVLAGGEQEPTPLPLLALDDSGAEITPNGEYTIFPIAFRRLQFRIATANNGRRRELQQHFLLHLNVVGTLTDGTKVNLSENNTAPVIVRGRSPRNFQARKEIPLAGSSSSRGVPPELHVATNVGALTPILHRSATMPKAEALELPRTAFTFDSSTLSGSPANLRQTPHHSWSNTHIPVSPPHIHPLSANSGTPSSTYPPSGVNLDTYMQPMHLSNPQPLRSNTLPGARSALSHYTFPPSGMASSPDDNPRPTKSPRYNDPPHFGGIGRYNALGSTMAREQILPQPRATTAIATEYFPSSFSMVNVPPINTSPPMLSSWTATNASPHEHGDSQTYHQQALPAVNSMSGRPQQTGDYQYSGALNTNEQQQTYAKAEQGGNHSSQQQYGWNQ